MTDVNKNEEIINDEVVEATSEAELDASIDLDALMNQTSTSEENESDAASFQPSEIDMAIRAKKNETKGAVVETSEIEKDGVKTLKPNIDTEERAEEFTAKLDEQKLLADKAKLVTVIKKPENAGETAEMMDEIDAVTIDEKTGKAILPEGSKYLITKEQAEEAKKTLGENNEEEPSETVEGNTEESRKKYKSNIVKILIDKTGLGSNIVFNEDETKQIQSASEIHLVEVESQELKTIQYDRPEDTESFLDNIDKYQLSVSKAKMTFPGSGFKGELTGLSYGEFADISLDTSSEAEDYLDFDKMYKKMSVIYSKLINPSCGQFIDFKDFLKKFAYIDIPLATYGLLIATQPEFDTISLRCNRESCKKGFNHKYATRSLIDFDSANTHYLEMIKDINEAAPEKYIEVAEKSPVRVFKALELPTTKYVVEFGLASCFDYLYGILDVLKKYQEDVTIDEEDPRLLFCAMLQAIRSISIPQKNGRYYKFTEPEQIIEILRRNMPSKDVQILYSAYTSYTSQFQIDFSIKGIKCPHCGAVTDAIGITPDELVFQIQQLALSTPVILDNFQDF